MKKIFTLALVMAMTIASFAQVKSVKPSVKNMKAEKAVSVRGVEEGNPNMPVAPVRSIMATTAEETDLAYSTYDWQSNAAQRNFTAVWPDGYAVMCYTISSDPTTSFSDRGTGLAIFDPAVGEWEFTDGCVEGVKTGFGSIARYKENGLVVAAHTSNDCRIFIVEDFREGNRDFGQGIIMPTTGENGTTYDPCWPVVQCSGENLDIIHIITTEYALTVPYASPLLYSRYENGEFTVIHRILPNLDENNLSDGGSNIAYFMEYDPAKPNRVSFILNNAWSDCKAVISEDNGQTWNDRVFFQHPGINTTYSSDDGQLVYYPRWTDAEFDDEDNLNIVYEVNATTGEPGSGSYYPSMGAVAFWSETLPLNDSCVGGIGEGHGHPFIMDTNYLSNDIETSCWYWSNAPHEPVPEHFGLFYRLDENYQAIPWTEESPDVYYWLDLSDSGIQNADAHGKYNCGNISMPSMHMSGDRVYAFWSMLAGDSQSLYYDTEAGIHKFRIFAAKSYDRGQTWFTPKHVLSGFMNRNDEMVYGQLIPFIYTDDEGEYLWYCYQNDKQAGTFVQGDETVATDNLYKAVKVYVNEITGMEEESGLTVAQDINVYPNPAQGSFNVQLTNAGNVNIYNTVGQLVKTYNNVVEVNVNLEAGMYFVNAGNQTVKVVVK